MVWDLWSVEGDVGMTEHWRTVVPDLSVDTADDRTGIANDRYRVAAIRQRYVLELKHLTGAKSPSFVTSGVTRLSDWSPLTPEERLSSRPDSPFALAGGVPSGLASERPPLSDDLLDFALLIFVPPALLPKGALFLDGAPLVIARRRPVEPLAAIAGDLVSGAAG
jgi:hypothetical protein